MVIDGKSFPKAYSFRNMWVVLKRTGGLKMVMTDFLFV